MCARVERGESSAEGYVYVNGIMGGMWTGEAEEKEMACVCACACVCRVGVCVRGVDEYRRDSKFAGAV